MFNKNLVPWIVIAILLVFIVVQTCTDNPDEDRIREVAEMEARLKRADDVITDSRKYMRELRTRMRQDSIWFQDTITIIEKENVQLERNLARQRAKPEIIKIISQNADIDTLVQTYDSIISKRDEQIYLQAKYVSQLQTDLSSIENNFREQIALHVEKFENEKKIADEYRRELRKKRRGAKLARVLVPLSLAAGFVLGTQL